MSSLPNNSQVGIEFSEYHSVDFNACIELFKSNCPSYFAEQELADFEAFLLDLPGPYLVLLNNKEIIGCGGYAFNQADGSADLCWGMIHKDFHQQGFGKALLQERLTRIKMNPDIAFIHLNTCQLTDVFFEKSGFSTEKVTKDGFATGLDRYDMKAIIKR